MNTNCQRTTAHLSLDDSFALKGIALILLLTHHLFYIQKGLYDDIMIGSNHGVANMMGSCSKFCVAIFVFLSGYGLTLQTEKSGIKNIWQFYKHRLSKLMISYWFICCIFVPIGVFFFHRSFDDVYHDHVLIKAIVDMLGLAFLFGYYGYNATWWFMSCIIVLYLFYPILYKLMKTHQLEMLFLFIALSLLPIPFLQHEIIKYTLPFVLGIVIAIHGIPSVGGGKIALLIIVFSILLMFAQRMMMNRPIIIDSALCVAMSTFWLGVPRIKLLESSLSYLGRHSMNIFLFHTFIFSHWFKDFIYASRNPLLIFLLLLSICLAISIIVEQFKKAIKIDKLIKSI